MLPHVDEMRPIHNLDSMAALVAALSGDLKFGNDVKTGDPREWLRKAG
jgi:hypothetical protein